MQYTIDRVKPASCYTSCLDAQTELSFLFIGTHSYLLFDSLTRIRNLDRSDGYSQTLLVIKVE